MLKRSEHWITNKEIDPDVLNIIGRLNRHGHTAFITGGAVQNLLQGIKPKDFDLVTNASQSRIKRLYSNAFIIGRRFRLAHIHCKGGKIIELATFRRNPEEIEKEIETEEGNPRKIGTPMEDAAQRDITINAMFYDVASASVIDYMGGLKDLADQCIRVIGDPAQRFVEDPVRMLRVVRHAARLGFHIEKETEEAIHKNLHLLVDCPGSRLYEEMNKDLNYKARRVIEALIEYGMLPSMIGDIGKFYQEDKESATSLLSLLDLKDGATAIGISFTQEELYSLFLWPWVEARFAQEKGDLVKALTDEVASGLTGITLPKKVRSPVVHILIMMRRLDKALRTGRIRKSWPRQKSYESASRLLFLIRKGRMPSERESFKSLLRRAQGRRLP